MSSCTRNAMLVKMYQTFQILWQTAVNERPPTVTLRDFKVNLSDNRL